LFLIVTYFLFTYFSHWFGDDGELKTIRDPIQYPLLHPVMPKGLADPEGLVEYVPVSKFYLCS